MAKPIPAPLAADANQAEIRRAMAHDLDRVIPSRFRHATVQITLTVEECREAFERRRLHMLGAEQMDAWAKASGLGMEWACPVNRAYAFWHGLGDSRALPDQLFQGLRSAVKMAEFHVVLLSYQSIAPLPDGVCLQAAGRLLPEVTFRRLLDADWNIVHVADLARCLALSESGGWFIDTDTVWLKPHPAPPERPCSDQG